MSRWRKLRPLLFCALFLLLFDAGVGAWRQKTPSYPWDGRFREGNIQPYEVEGALAALKQAKGSYNVVLIGDSVLRGAYLYDWETVGSWLQYRFSQDMPDRNVRVWNFALAGSRGADKYAMLRQVAPIQPDLVIINLDYKFFNSPTLSYNFLADALQDDPDATALDKALKLDPYEAQGAHTVRHFWSLYRNREWMNYQLFGGAPFDIVGSWVEKPRVSRHASVAVDQRQPWYDKGLTAGPYKDLYGVNPITPDNPNYVAWQHMLTYIDQNQVPAFVYWTPQNHGLLAPLINNPEYERNRETVASLFAGHQAIYRDFDRAMDDLDPRAGAFIDADHLTPKGSIHLGDLIYDQLNPPGIRRVREGSPK